MTTWSFHSHAATTLFEPLWNPIVLFLVIFLFLGLGPAVRVENENDYEKENHAFSEKTAGFGDLALNFPPSVDAAGKHLAVAQDGEADFAGGNGAAVGQEGGEQIGDDGG